jgi:hypothetical protein
VAAGRQNHCRLQAPQAAGSVRQAGMASPAFHHRASTAAVAGLHLAVLSAVGLPCNPLACQVERAAAATTVCLQLLSCACWLRARCSLLTTKRRRHARVSGAQGGPHSRRGGHGQPR